MRKLKDFYKNRRLGQKILINSILIIVVTIVSLSAIVTSVSAKYLSENTDNSTRLLVNQINSNINLYIDNISGIMNYIEKDARVRQFLEAKDEDIIGLEVRTLLKELEDANREIAGMMIIDKYGHDVSNSMERISRDNLTKEEWFQQAKAKMPDFQLISNPIGRNIIYKDDLYSADDVVSICRAVLDANGDFAGVILIDFKLEIFTEIIEETEIGKSGFIYIQDENNAIVYSPINDIIYRINPEWVTEGRESTIASIDMTEYKLLWQNSDYTGWKVVGVFSLDEMLAPIRDIILLVAGISLVIIFLAVVISSILSKSITLPLAKLESLMKKSEDGELNVRFETKYSDEIGMLGKRFNRMIKSINNLIDMVYEEQHKKREAELEIFRSQIKPHFLYNTLDTIHWLIKEKKNEDALIALRALTNLFRISLSKGADVIRLQDEIKHVESYLIIQKIRYDNKLTYHISCPEELLLNNVSKITLQPIVENAIYHGIKEKRGAGHISISVRMADADLYFLIEDDGVGIEPESLKTLQGVLAGEIERTNQYGLINVNERIKLAYGSEYGVTIESVYGEGTKVYIKHPVL